MCSVNDRHCIRNKGDTTDHMKTDASKEVALCFTKEQNNPKFF